MKPSELFNLCNDADFKTVGDDVQYSTRLIDGHPTLIFQGSRSKEDWLNNFKFWRKPYKNQEHTLWAHSGFVNAYKSANELIMGDFIAICDIVNTTPYIIGHSYGGAIAVLSCEDFHYRTGKKPVVVTFGAPHVLSGKKSVEYVKTCGQKFIQFMERNDIVPFMPPIPGYRHIDKTHIGDSFCPFKLFRADIYHQAYNRDADYGEIQDV
jgi:Lipase (class 3).